MLARSLRPSVAALRAHAAAARMNSSSAPTIASIEMPAKVKEITDLTTHGKQLISGAPEELSVSGNRLVRIYKEAQSATQNGNRNTDSWKLEWDILGKGNRWENDLTGYQSTADYMQATRIVFTEKEEAVRFAESNGWDYYVTEPKVKKFKKKDYSANFYHSKGPLKHIFTK